jgi:hypothetical protein
VNHFAEYRAGKLSYRTDWVVNEAIEVGLDKGGRMFLKGSDGKELQVLVVKKVRPEQ